MSALRPADDSGWAAAATIAALVAVDPVGTGGALLRSSPGAARDHWLAYFTTLLPPGTPVRRVPLHITDGRLLGGLDLAATLRAGQPMAETGVLAACNGGLILLPMAERITATAAARIAAVMDTRILALEREGFTLRTPVGLGVVALDESQGPDEAPPAVLAERLAFRLDLSALRVAQASERWHTVDDVAAARARLAQVTVDTDIVEALCAAALALGVDSLRATVLALNVAKAAAALDGRDCVNAEDASLAAQLVLSPRATRMPAAPPDEHDDAPAPDEGDAPPPESAEADTPPQDATPPTPPPDASEDSDDKGNVDGELSDTVVAAAQAAIPAGLLAQLAATMGLGVRARSSGRAGAFQKSGLRGRPAGVQRGEPRRGARLNVIETLRAAAPWQRLRHASATPRAGKVPRVLVTPDDFRVTRCRERRETTTIFVVDASGSAALARLAEAKGAVELLLADCYVRRDRVAVIAFRGRGAEVLLPPTRSLVRAKRGLAALAGGGGTPLAAAIDAASAMADSIVRRGGSPTVVFLTDGRANIARDGTPGRQRAEVEARDASRLFAAARATVLLIDTSPRGEPLAQALALAMQARYLALPYANADTLSRAVRSAVPSGPRPTSMTAVHSPPSAKPPA